MGPRAVERRQWIRDAWTSRLPEEMQAVFVIGGTNVVEDAWKGDILRVNARETYPPGEKMLAFMSYCVSHLWSAGFCIKTDDDVVISGRKLLYTLAPLYAASRHIYLVQRSGRPSHRPRSKSAATAWDPNRLGLRAWRRTVGNAALWGHSPMRSAR